MLDGYTFMSPSQKFRVKLFVGCRVGREMRYFLGVATTMCTDHYLLLYGFCWVVLWTVCLLY